VEVCKTNKIPYIHITTRQDLQLHDVQPENVHSLVIELTNAGFPIRGGGGNTFRNIIVDEMSDISENAVFDVRPYAFELNSFILDYDRAFELPRKFKIGFFFGSPEKNAALFQDLSFSAVMHKNGKAFDVYAGGGLGRESRKGVRIFSALPAEEIFRCAAAGIDMFYECGDREKHDKARFRFVLDSMGKEKFINTFLDYFNKSNVEKRETKSEETIPTVPFFKTLIKKQPFFEKWFNNCVCRTRGKDIYALKFLILEGNLELFRLNGLANLADKYTGGIVRLTRSQDILLPHAHSTALPYMHNELQNGELAAFPEVSSYSKIVSCVGSSVCKMGLLDAAKYATLLSHALDGLFKDFLNISDSKKQQIFDAIKISGCSNSCSGHAVAALGFEGIKRRNSENETDLYFKVFIGGSLTGEKSSLAEAVDEFYIPAKHLDIFVKELVAAYLIRNNATETFADHIYSIGKNAIKTFYKITE
jgi:sulfite reductase beta subunit-like hemoprotein